MTTATKAKPKSELTELERFEARWAKAAEEAKALGREHHTKLTRARELGDQRQRLTHRQPGLVDHHQQPLATINDNPVVQLDRETEALGDLADLRAQVDRTPARACSQTGRQAYVAEHYTAILEALEAEGDRHAEALNAAIATVAEELERYIGHCQRLAGLATMVRADTRVSGLDQASAVARQMRDWNCRLRSYTDDRARRHPAGLHRPVGPRTGEA